MASDDYLLSILATFKDGASGDLKKFGTAVLGAGKATDKAGKQVGGFGDKLAVMSAKLVSIRTGVQQAGEMFQQAFDFAELGAQSLQTADSFEVLLEKVEASPDLLDDLRSASRNTISDMKLMSATSTLLAGAQGDLATALAGSTPKLMEIAKAANAINPSLGDTAFLYESLATGIKRASPMILDNLGLTIKIGEANERFAESLGKSVDQLTAEEQKMALLNETLRAGNVLIDQAGDNIDSATDDFARFEAAIENSKVALAEMAVPVFAPLLEQLTDLVSVSGEEAEAIDRSREAAEKRAKTSEEYAEIVREQMILEGVAAGESVKAMEDRLFITQKGELAAKGFAAHFVSWERDRVAAMIKTNRAMGNSTKELEARYRELTDQMEDVAIHTIDLKWETTELGAAEAAQREELEELAQSYLEAGDAIGGLQVAGYGLNRTLIEAEDIVTGLDESLRGLARANDIAADKTARLATEEKALELAGERAAYQQEQLRDSLAELGIVMRGAVGKEMQGFIDDQVMLSIEVSNTREELALLETKLGTMSRGVGVGQLRTDLEGIVVEMNALGPEPEKLDRGREAIMRTLEVRHLEANEALQAQEAAAGAYETTTEKAEELRGEIRELEGQMRDAQIAHKQATEGIIFDLAEQSGAAVELQWALAEAMGQIDQKTLQAWGATQKINQLYAEQVITLDEAVALYEELADWAEAPPAPPPIEQGIFGMAEWAGGEVAGIPPGMQELFDEIETARLGAIPEEIEAELKIENLDGTMEAFSSIESMVKFISGQHKVAFQISTTGEWPGGAGGGNGAGGGAPTPPPGFSGESFQSGGIVAETGLAFVHAGELIIPPMEAQQMREGEGGTTIAETNNNFNLNVTSVQELSSIMQEFAVMQALVG